MSYPTKLKLFKAWAKAMEEGATVDRPNYGKTARARTRTGSVRQRPRINRSTSARRRKKRKKVD